MSDKGIPIVTLTNQPEWSRILVPTFALVLLSFGVLAILGILRIRKIKNREIPTRYFELMQMPAGAHLPATADAAARNFTNLFEVPVLFYALVPLLLFTGLWDDTCVALLWAFVVLRYLHTAVHLTFNAVPVRFALYLASAAVLLAEWVRFVSAVV
jgi:hypothetical protein